MNKEPRICETCRYGLIRLNHCLKHDKSLDKNRVCDDYSHFKAKYTYIPNTVMGGLNDE